MGRINGSRVALTDIVAGVSMALVLIPQALAYATLAGLPPYVGLYAAALPPIAAAFFASGTRTSRGTARSREFIS
ncbi:MAG: SulP family inorganic anion transporter [Longimicrobiales bacterium]